MRAEARCDSSMCLKLGNLSKLSRTLFLSLLFILITSFFWLLDASASSTKTLAPLVLGAERYSLYLPLLAGKKVALVVNQTSVLYTNTDADKDDDKNKETPIHLLDFLITKEVDVTTLFAPEHGIRGQKSAGEYINNSIDRKTQLPILSIYGENKKPEPKVLQNIDVIIFDIQDVGTRFYTYISSMHYMMEAAAQNNIEFIVLDRPNPNGEFIDGPILESQFKSFVGMHPIPLLHGLSVGELAQMIVGEKWIDKADELKLKVIPMLAYYKQRQYIVPIAPSPNLPNYQAIRLYPSLCLFEPSAVSIGRGTDFPFQVTGHTSIHLDNFVFTPVSKPVAAKYPKHEKRKLQGYDLRHSSIEGLDLSLLIEYYRAFSAQNKDFFSSIEFFDKLAGTNKLRLALEKGHSEAQIRQSWQKGLTEYKKMRVAYLLYSQH